MPRLVQGEQVALVARGYGRDQDTRVSVGAAGWPVAKGASFSAVFPGSPIHSSRALPTPWTPVAAKRTCLTRCIGKNPDLMKHTQVLILLISTASAMSLLADDAKPGSTPILAVVPDLSHLQKWDDSDGDTADPFWADDGNLYFFNCDGRGFGKTPRMNLCFNELTGPDLQHLQGAQVNQMAEYGGAQHTGPDHATWKATGQECIDGVFYAFVDRNVYGSASKDHRQTSSNASLIESHDGGHTWKRTAQENYDSPMWPGSRFGAPGFIHHGQNGGQVQQDNATQFVYAITNNGFWDNGDDMILARVARADLPKLRASDWSYYTAGDGLADGSWSNRIGDAKPILSLPGKFGWISPTYIAALHRYLLVSWSVTTKKWFEPQRVTYDFYQAEQP